MEDPANSITKAKLDKINVSFVISKKPKSITSAIAGIRNLRTRNTPIIDGAAKLNDTLKSICPDL